MYYTVIKHSGHFRTLEKCRKHSPAARVVYISLVFSNARRVLSQCNTRLRLLYLLNIYIYTHTHTHTHTYIYIYIYIFFFFFFFFFFSLNCVSYFTDLDPCRPNPCLNSGACLHTDGGFVCNCSIGFKGKHCQGRSLLSSIPAKLNLLTI